MFKKLFGLFLAVIFCGFSYSSEAIVNDRRPVIVGFSYLQENSVTKAMTNGAKRAVKDLKAKLIIRDGRGDSDIQLAQIQDLAAQQAGCLVVILRDEILLARIKESRPPIHIPTVTVPETQTDAKAAENAGYDAVKKAWDKVKSRSVKPSFYNGY